MTSEQEPEPPVRSGKVVPNSDVSSLVMSRLTAEMFSIIPEFLQRAASEKCSDVDVERNFAGVGCKAILISCNPARVAGIFQEMSIPHELATAGGTGITSC